MSDLRKIIYALGIIFTLCGAGLLCLPLYEAYLLLNNPEQSYFLNSILQAVNGDEKAAFGIWDGKNFELTLSSNAQKTIYFSIGFLTLCMISSILVGIIHAGIQMIRVAMLNDNLLEKFKKDKKSIDVE